MVTYNSLGVSAFLSVTELAPTLSDDVILRVGDDQRETAERIAAQIASGRALPERLCRPNGSKVGVLQFVGACEDMHLFVVEAGDTLEADSRKGHASQQTELSPAVPLSTGPGAGNSTSNTHSNTAPTRSQDNQSQHATSGTSVPEQANTSPNAASGRDAESIANVTTDESIASKNNGTNAIGTSNAYSQTTTGHAINTTRASRTGEAHDGPLALTLNVNCRKLLQKKAVPSLTGKDLKLEVFLNGELVEVSYELLHSGTLMGKKGGLFQFSGTRFHRQSQKPWVYTTTGDSNVAGSQSRWNDISKSLASEANARGMDKWHQRPCSAQFLDALAQMAPPGHIQALNTKYAVIDLVITAGHGNKHGPWAQYISQPTRMQDAAFKYAVVEDAAPDIAPYFMHNGEVRLQSDDPAVLEKGASFLDDDTSTSKLELLDSFQTGPPHTAAATIEFCKEVYHDVLYSTSVKKALLSYETSQGIPNRGRTMRQRLGDVLKMSIQKKKVFFKNIQGELDEKTQKTIERALEMEEQTQVTPARKKARFSLDDEDSSPMNDREDSEREDAYTFQPRQPDFPMSPIRSMISGLRLPPSMVTPRTVLEPYPMASIEQGLMLTAQPQTPKRTKASALVNSPIVLPVKRKSSRSEPADDEPLPARRRSSRISESKMSNPANEHETGSAAVGAAWQHGAAHADSSSRRPPPTETLEDALENFQIPALCEGSVVTYPEGDAHRRIIKARGGDFHEEQIVVGMRFIVR